jgi:hypothetical protein
MLSSPSTRSVPIARAATLGWPWLAVMAFSATIAWTLTMALTSRLPEVTEPKPAVLALSVNTEACSSNAWLVYAGQGTWIRDPRHPCKSEDSK